MAGIGFVLRSLLQQNNLSGVLRAYLNAIMISAGYWIATVVVLATLYFFTNYYLGFTESVRQFRAIIFYNFALSLIISAPITVISTRYISDSVYQNHFSSVSGLFISSMIFLFALAFPLPLLLYTQFVTMDGLLVCLAIANFMIVTAIWQCTIFLSSLKYYTVISWGIVIGACLSIITGVYLNRFYQEAGFLMGFNIGSCFILALLVAAIYSAYPSAIHEPLKIFFYLRKYWLVALGAFFYNSAIWIDKVIMLFSPEAERLGNHLFIYPAYNTTMFLAYLTVIPVMASFVLSQETDFFENYLHFYKGILENDTFGKIKKNYKSLIKSMRNLFYHSLIIQTVICALTLIMAPAIFDLLQINLLNIGTFRYAVLGASFQIITLFAIILLAYYDYQLGVFIVQFSFFLSNSLLTIITLKMGPLYYGLGYCLSTILSLLVAGIVMERYVRKLIYHTFITKNQSVE